MGPKVTRDEARQAETKGRVRWVLGVSLALAVIAMVGAYLFMYG